MEIIDVTLVVVILFQFILLYKLSQKTKFKLSDVRTINDMQQYLQVLDDKFESKYNDIDDVISNLNQQIVTFTRQANMAILKSSKNIENIILPNKKILDEQNIKTQSVLDNIQEKILSFDENIKKTQAIIPKLLNVAENKLSILLDKEFSPIKNHISKDFKRLKRYEDEYDQKITKRYNNEIFRILDYIKKERIHNDSEALLEIEENILIMLENSGIKRLKLVPGEIYDEKYDQFVSIEYCETFDKNANGKIKEIKKYGYFSTLLSNENQIIKKPIKEARVVVYQLNGKEEK